MNHNSIKFLTNVYKPLGQLYHNWPFSHPPQRTIITYHGIAKKQNFNCVSETLFAKQLAWLKANYNIVSLTTLVNSLTSKTTPEKNNLLAITFDDGFTNFADLALPFLQKHNCSATIFVPTSKVAGYNDWDEGEPGFHKMRIMTFRELRQLPKELIDIGSHGCNHIPLANSLPYHKIKEEIVTSKNILEQNVGRKIQFFAFPYGVYPFSSKTPAGNDVRALLSRTYSAACTSRWGRFNCDRNLFSLRRIGVWESDSLDDFIDKVKGYYDWLTVKEKIGRVVKQVKMIV